MEQDDAHARDLCSGTGMLGNGFTTIRDVGGATRHHRDATAEWLIPGPRLFIGGPVLSQTGGHGESSHAEIRASQNTTERMEAYGDYQRIIMIRMHPRIPTVSASQAWVPWASLWTVVSRHMLDLSCTSEERVEVTT